MNGGLIESCLANGDGGGVYVNGMFRMTGGTIYNCGTEEAAYRRHSRLWRRCLYCSKRHV